MCIFELLVFGGFWRLGFMGVEFLGCRWVCGFREWGIESIGDVEWGFVEDVEICLERSGVLCDVRRY